MKLIVGLGNPGGKYEATRHNVGFMVAETLAAKHGIRLRTRAYDSIAGKGRIAGEDVAIILPQTYMNRSGQAVKAFSARNKVMPGEILVVCDDVNLSLGVIRLRRTGSAGGHNGLASIIESLGSADFVRLRVGIGRKDSGREVGGPQLSGYVLSVFSKKEAEELECIVETAAECCETWIRNGAERAANLFNAKNRKE